MLSKIIPYLKYRYLLYFFALVAGWPCVFYLMGWLPFYKTNYIVLLILAGATAFIRNAYRFVPIPISIIILFQIFSWSLYGVIYSDSSYFTRVFLLIITFSILGIQLSYRNKFEFIRTYNFWLAFQAVAGTIGFVLVIVGLLNPISQFIEMDGRPGYFYGLFATNAVFEGFIRNAGFFDEPGALAFWGIFALLLNKLYINNKKIEYLLLFGLVSTLSMAYFIQVFAYFFFFYKNQRKKILLPAILFLLVLIGIASFSEGLNDVIFGRFTINEQTGSLAGDNRSDLMERCWRIFTTSPVIGVGAMNLAKLYRFNFLHCDVSLLLSAREETIVKTILPKGKSLNCIAIPNSLSWEHIESSTILQEKKKEVLVVARLYNPEKRIDLVLKIWKELQKRNLVHEWVLRIVGDGHHKNLLMDMAKKYKLKNVVWEGWRDPKPFYRDASIFMMTSACEGWGLTLTESMQTGTVPLAIDTYPALHDIITDGYNGYIIKGNNVKTYADHMKFLIENPLEREKIALNGLESCKRFSIEKVMDKWAEMLNNVD